MATYTARCSAVGGFGYATNFTLYVVLSETEISTDNNKSKVNYNVYCQSSGSGSINATHLKYFNINGQDIINSNVNVNVSSPNAYISIANGSIEIPHNSDGTKAISFSAKIQGTTYGVLASLSGTFTLTTIARASSISCTTANIEETAIVTISSASANFRHTVIAYFGNLSVQIATNVAGGIISWTIPNSFYTQIPNSKSGVGTITCNTYNNGNLIGSKSAVLTITTNEQKCKPTLSATVVDTNQTTIALTGSNAKLVKHKSTAKVTITTSAKNGASISSKKVNNTVVSGDNISISAIETNTFLVNVTDSRGYTNSVVLKPTVINYIPLSINATIKRTQPTTGEVDLTFSGNYFNGNFGNTSNTLTINWYYREKGNSTWISGGALAKTINGNMYNNGTSSISLGKSFDYQKTYEFYLNIVDKLTTLRPTYIVNKGIPVFNWGKNFVNVNGELLVNNEPIKRKSFI